MSRIDDLNNFHKDLQTLNRPALTDEIRELLLDELEREIAKQKINLHYTKLRLSREQLEKGGLKLQPDNVRLIPRI